MEIEEDSASRLKGSYKRSFGLFEIYISTVIARWIVPSVKAAVWPAHVARALELVPDYVHNVHNGVTAREAIQAIACCSQGRQQQRFDLEIQMQATFI